jgi:cytochrome c556
MTTKKVIALFLLIIISAFTIAATKADKRTANSIERIMKKMKKPEKELKKLERSKLYTKSSFAINAAALARDAKAMLRIKHPDKDFNDISKDLDQEMTTLLAAIKKKDFKAIKKSWTEAKGLCAECHDVYKDL